MISLLLAFLVVAGSQDFPDADDSVVEEPAEIVAPREAPRTRTADFPDAEPEAAPAAGKNWSTRTVRPRDISPGRSLPPAGSAPAAAQPIVRSVTVRSAPRPAEPAPVAPQSTHTAFIAGYHDALWGDFKEHIEKIYTADRPLVEKGEGKWMIQDKCEGEDAVLVYAFPGGLLASIVCQYKRGLESSTPDYALYRKVRQSLTKFWGEPSSTNESPAPDSPSQAAQWDGKAGKATLAYDAEAAYVQLKVERRQ